MGISRFEGFDIVFKQVRVRVRMIFRLKGFDIIFKPSTNILGKKNYLRTMPELPYILRTPFKLHF